MFPCATCHRTTNPGEKATQIVIKTRPASYPFIENAHHFRMDGKKEVRDDPGGRGTEISQEVTVCPDCAAGSQLEV